MIVYVEMSAFCLFRQSKADTKASIFIHLFMNVQKKGREIVIMDDKKSNLCNFKTKKKPIIYTPTRK